MSTPDLHDFDFDLAVRRAEALRREEVAHLIDHLVAPLARVLHLDAQQPSAAPVAPATPAPSRC